MSKYTIATDDPSEMKKLMFVNELAHLVVGMQWWLEQELTKKHSKKAHEAYASILGRLQNAAYEFGFNIDTLVEWETDDED